MAKILVIDDDADICDAIRLVLTKQGHEVTTADNRTSGKRRVEELRPALVILDVMMEEPDDGFVLARDLRKIGFTNPILMLTSIGHVTGLDFGKDEELVPVDEFQEKPVTPAKLLEKVNRLLEKGGSTNAGK